MTEIRFYHLQKTPLDHALPMILEKAIEGKFKILIKVPDATAKKRLDDWLWNYKSDSFLAHGVAGGDFDADQPILISENDDDIPNNANMLVLTDGCTAENLDRFDLCCEMLNGHVEAQVQNARTRWKDYKDKGFQITYWAQDEQGRWSKKA